MTNDESRKFNFFFLLQFKLVDSKNDDDLYKVEFFCIKKLHLTLTSSIKSQRPTIVSKLHPHEKIFGACIF